MTTSRPLFLTALLLTSALFGQNPPGQTIGNITTRGDLIVLELDRGALGESNLFDLQHRTLHFTPAGSRYRVENRPLQWDPDFGTPINSPHIVLHRFTFRFSGKQWNSILVGRTGSIRFSDTDTSAKPDAYGNPDAGISLGRFDQLTDAATALIDSSPAICVFLKPRLSGPRYAKELSDRIVITWELTEPFGSLLDFTWFKTVNRFQAVLYRDGSIDMSYQEISARDAIVGIYPLVSGKDKPLTTLTAARPARIRPSTGLRRVELATVDDSLLKVTFEMGGPVPHEGDPTIKALAYKVSFALLARAKKRAAVTWAIEGRTDPYNPKSGPARYVASGSGVLPAVRVSGNAISIQGVVPPALRSALVAVSAAFEIRDDVRLVESLPARKLRLTGIQTPDVHLSSLTPKDGPFAFVYEAFHYLSVPRSQDLSCSVIRQLGDKFDFLAYYSDFRIDSQEASSPSFGPAAGDITGIGTTQHDLDTYCSRGRFQWALAQPVYVGADEMYKQPPPGAPTGNVHGITFYTRELSHGPTAATLDYNYAVGHLGHEIAHRWGAYISAKVNGKTISLGPWPHWATGLNTPVAFPYSLPIEASTLGGGVWHDNQDGTFTQLRDGYFVPATGYSYLDLYLMGLAAASEVPDFFLLDNLTPHGQDNNGHHVFAAKRASITIHDVIAANGLRHPDPEHSQREFNTGFVVIVEHGKSPSPEVIERADGIRQQWMHYWDVVTGHRSSMTTHPR